ncbi:MAG: type II toxin-antitoxin system PemK/MazF family toxin [Chlamydiota bacterium]|nr:type II toxin-antitoxin system PemK/MazF family toxin [Chlamydiota bacterium]
MELKKGDIVLVQAPANPSGTEIQKTRPAVVVSPKRNGYTRQSCHCYSNYRQCK